MFRAFETGFSFANDDFGMGVLFGIVPGFIPELMAVLETGPGCGDVDLLRPEGAVGKDSYAFRQNLNESPADAVGTLPDLATVEADFPRSKNRDERSVSVEDFEVAVARRYLDRIRRLVDEDAIGSYEPDL